MFLFPSQVTLEEKTIRLETLQLAHAPALRVAADDGSLWEPNYSSVPAPGKETAYIEKAIEMGKGGKALSFAVIQKQTGKFIGSSRFYNYEPADRHVMLGYTWFAKSVQGTGVNTECKLLMLTYAFETANCGVVEFQVDSTNARSLRAVEKLGAKRDGVLRNHKIRRDGTFRDTVSFSIIAAEWSEVKKRLEKAYNSVIFRP